MSDKPKQSRDREGADSKVGFAVKPCGIVAIQASALSRSYGSVEALRGIDLQVNHHEFVAIVGPSGCGKTTLLSLFSGFDDPSGGTLVRSGEVRTIFQRDGLFPWLTCAENIAIGLRDVGPSERNHRKARLLDLINLNGFADRYPHQLSGGMRQLVELARAIAGKADILLMDEPFSSLDYLTRLRMRGELARLLAEYPRTVVLVTHDIEEAAQLADRIIVMTDRPGRIRIEHSVTAPRPRTPTDPVVVETVRTILSEMGMATVGISD
jgi:ABC-type nitrate/sulfonate/bicarbonate transport system ATPase subunit